MIDINLAPEHLRKKKKNASFSGDFLNLPKEAILGLLGGLIALLFVVDSLLLLNVLMKFSQHAQLKRHWEKILPEKEKVDLVINEVRSLQNKINAIEKVTMEKRIFWAQKLNDVSDLVPRGVWINKLSINEKVLLIDGSAVSKIKDEMVAVGNFVSGLKGNKSFMSGLANIELGSIQRRQLKSLDVVDFIITAKLP